MRTHYTSTLIFTLWLISQSTIARAEVVIWREDFEGNDAINRWSLSSEQWEIGLPASAPSPGPGRAFQGQNSAGTVLSDNYPISFVASLERIESFVVPSAEFNPHLQFFHWRENRDDSGLVQIRTQGDDWQTLATYSGDIRIWIREFIGLSEFAGSTIDLRFLFESGESNVGAGWYLDEITVIRDSITDSPEPTIIEQPGDQIVTVGDSVTFKLTVEGQGPFTYQWRLNGANIESETSDTLIIENATASDGGSYSVVVSNAAGITTSEVARLFVTIPILSFADDFDDKGTIAALSGVGKATNKGASFELQEPLHSATMARRSVWLQWNIPVDGIVTMTTKGSDFDTLLHAYRGESLANLVSVAQDDDSAGFFTSEVIFNVKSGEFLNIVVDGVGTAEGDIVFQWNLEPSPQQVPVITTQPTGAVFTGEPITLSVTTEEPETLTYQWELNGVPIPGATSSTFELPSVNEANIGNYVVQVTNDSRSIRSSTARVEIGSETGEPTKDKFIEVAREGVGNANPNNVLNEGAYQGQNPFLIQSQNSGIRVPYIPRNLVLSTGFVSLRMGRLGQRIFNNSSSSTEETEPIHGGTLGGASRLLGLEINEPGTLLIDTAGSAIDTIIALYKISGGSWLNTELIAENDDASINDRQSKLLQQLGEGVYLVVIDGKKGATGKIELNWVLGDTPRISNSPQELNFAAWKTATIRLDVTGAPEPKIIWYKGGVLMKGQTGSTLEIANLQLSDSGIYTASAANALGQVVSAPFQINIQGFSITKPTLTIQGQFSFEFPSELGESYVIEYSSDLEEWKILHQSKARTDSVIFVDLDSKNTTKRYYRIIK